MNEITINWNAPLVWITAFLDERGAVGWWCDGSHSGTGKAKGQRQGETQA